MTSKVSSESIDIRFSGQYYDHGTGLAYNYNRYYDADVGRYLRADPLGLNGGINVYLYGNANPIRFVDPLGLFAWQGKFFYFGGSEVLGAGRFIYNLISECIDGKQVQVRVEVNVAGVDIGFPVSGVGGHLEFEDSRSAPDPAAFGTEFLYVGVSASWGIGIALSAASFDAGTIQSKGLSLLAGVDLSYLTEVAGTGKVESVKTYDCSCGEIRRIY